MLLDGLRHALLLRPLLWLPLLLLLLLTRRGGGGGGAACSGGGDAGRVAPAEHAAATAGRGGGGVRHGVRPAGSAPALAGQLPLVVPSRRIHALLPLGLWLCDLLSAAIGRRLG